jgi:hypothetical protein
MTGMLQEGSVVPAAAPEAPATPPQSSVTRLVDVLIAPTVAGAAIGRDPRGGLAAVVYVVLVVLSVAAVWFTDTGRKLSLEAMRDALRQSGQSTDAVAKLAENLAFIAPMAVGVAAVGTVVVTVLVAGALWVLFSAAMGANLGFRHHFSIAAHAGIISGLGSLVTIGTMFVRGTMHASLSLAAFAPGLKPTSVAYMSLALFDFFTLWYMAALGLLVAGAGRLKPAVTVGTVLAIYALLGGAGVALKAALS